MSTYLQTHPETDEALTDISRQSPAMAEASYQTYFSANPKVADELKAIQQPVTELSTQCNTQVSPNAVTDALKSI